MARRPSLKPQLNQIRTWVGEGVTDIWIAHQLERTPAEVADFRRKHGLLRPDDPAPAPRPARTRKPAAAKPTAGKTAAAKPAAPAAEAEAEPPAAGDADGAEPGKRRRRGRRGGRGRGRARAGIPVVVEHNADGIVLRLDAAALAAPEYREQWAAITTATAAFGAAGITIAPAAADDATDDAGA